MLSVIHSRQSHVYCDNTSKLNPTLNFDISLKERHSDWVESCGKRCTSYGMWRRVVLLFMHRIFLHILFSSYAQWLAGEKQSGEVCSLYVCLILINTVNILIFDVIIRACRSINARFFRGQPTLYVDSGMNIYLGVNTLNQFQSYATPYPTTQVKEESWVE